MKNRKLKLEKLESGSYKTADNRFWVRDTYCPSEVGFHKDKRWLIEDKSGIKPFTLCNSSVAIQRVYTLSEAKEIIALIYQREQEETTLFEQDYQKCENMEFPGICWLSPHTGKLIKRSEALLEVLLCK